MNFHSRKHKKRIVSAVLCGSMMLSVGAQAVAFDSQTIFSSLFSDAQNSAASLADSGNALKRLGLVAGDDNGDLMLNRAGTRSEALTLFISLLGEHGAATETSYSYTFRDIPDWFSNFAGYGVYRSYTAGYSATQFGSYANVTIQEYTTFILRALGYDTSDFTWSAALDKAVDIGLCTQQQADDWQSKPFLRQQIMEISYLALSTPLKNSKCTLADKLIASGVITEQQAEAEHLTFGNLYIGSGSDLQTDISNYTSLPAGNYELHNIGSGKVMTANPISRQSDLYATGDANASTQLFRIQQNSDGSFRILSASNNGLAVDTNPTSGADAILWTVNGTECQDFVAKQLSNGAYAILLKGNPSMALTETSDSDVRLCAYTGAASQQWKLSDNSEDTAAATAKLQAIMKIYPNGKSLGSSYSFAGATQCMGFGREVFYRMYGQTAKWNYDGSPKSSADAKLFTVTARSSSYSASSIKTLISKAKPGDILQMNGPKIHTMVFVSSDSNGFTVYDANWTGPNKVSVRYVSYGAWVGRNSSGISLLHATNYPTT